MTNSDTSGILNSVKKSILLLELMSHYGPIGVRELSRYTEIDKSTISRILRTFEDSNIVIRSRSNGKFSLSPKLLEIATRSVVNFEIKERTEYLLQELQKQIKETVLLGVLLQTDIFYVSKIRAHFVEDATEINSEIGYRVPIYNSASGKAVLAFISESERERLLKSIVLKKATPNTITSRKALEKDLEETRKRGYSINNEELTLGIRAVGAPLMDYRGEVVGVVTIIGPVSRMSFDRIEQLGNVAVRYCKKMSVDLGYDK